MTYTHSLTVRPMGMLLPYLIVPLAWIVVAYDVWFGASFFKRVLPPDPDVWFFWPVVFTFPHIVASTLSFLDAEYVRHYRHALFRAILLALLLAIAVPIVFGGVAAFIVMAFYTMYHVLMQQFGIAVMYVKGCNRYWFGMFRWMAFIAGGCFLLLVYGSSLFSYEQKIVLHGIVRAVSAVSCVASVVLFALLLRRGVGAFPLVYFSVTLLIIPSSLFMYEMGYPVFTIMIPRVIHDLTAYVVYVTHDHNRNREGTRNVLYRLFGFQKNASGLLCVVLSILISYLLVHYRIQLPLLMYVTATLMFFHYYMEGIIWKKESLHRSYVSFGR